MRRTIIKLLGLLGTSPLLAVTFVWDGSESTLVSDDDNWFSGSAPSGNPNLEFNAGAPPNLTVYFDFGAGAITGVDDVNFGASAGAYTLTSDSTNQLQIGNITNNSGNLQIFDLELEFQNKETVLAGSAVQFNQAVTTKTGNTELTFSGSSEIIAGASNIFDSSINLFLNNTTLDLGNTTQSLTSITVTGDSVIDFGGAGAALTLFELNVIGGSLTVLNWTGDPGDFLVQSAVDSASLANITFDGWGDATWDSGTGVTPVIVPEPATYGAALISLMATFYALRRRRSSAPLYPSSRRRPS